MTRIAPSRKKQNATKLKSERIKEYRGDETLVMTGIMVSFADSAAIAPPVGRTEPPGRRETVGTGLYVLSCKRVETSLVM
jgi:hypothetical protein